MPRGEKTSFSGRQCSHTGFSDLYLSYDVAELPHLVVTIRVVRIQSYDEILNTAAPPK